jgi:hypothetical protein
MKKLFLLLAGAGMFGMLAGCGDLDSASDAAYEDQLNRAAAVPGVWAPHSSGRPNEPANTPVPGE